MSVEQVDCPDVHVTPDMSSEDVPHRLGGTCWCQPVVDYENPLTGARVYVHRRTMDGPAYDHGAERG